jgi:hypothetical protein
MLPEVQSSSLLLFVCDKILFERRDVFMKQWRIAATVATMVFLLLPAYSANNQSPPQKESQEEGTEVLGPEEFRARLTPGQGPSAQQAEKLRILVDKYTSDEEVLRLIDVYSKMGYEQFRAALHGMNKGAIQPIGGRGTKLVLHAAQSVPTEKGRQIILIAESYSWDIGTSFSFDQRFPFLVIQLDLNEKGKGRGKVFLSARIKLTSEGLIEMESYSTPPKPLWGVSTKK